MTLDDYATCTARRQISFTIAGCSFRAGSWEVPFVYADVVAPASASNPLTVPMPVAFLRGRDYSSFVPFHRDILCAPGVRSYYKYDQAIAMIKPRFPQESREKRREILREVLRLCPGSQPGTVPLRTTSFEKELQDALDQIGESAQSQ